VIETDGPWPYNGEFEGHPTEPTFLSRIVDAIATVKSLAREDVAEIITQNTLRLFHIS